MNVERDRRIRRAALEVPDQDVREVVRELTNILHQHSSRYAGEMPAQEANEYLAWRDRKEGFERMALGVLREMVA